MQMKNHSPNLNLTFNGITVPFFILHIISYSLGEALFASTDIPFPNARNCAQFPPPVLIRSDILRSLRGTGVGIVRSRKPDLFVGKCIMEDCPLFYTDEFII